MPKTHVRPSRDLRNNYADVVRILDDHDHVIITNNGVGEIALINMDIYAEFEEFLHHRFIYDELQKSKAKAGEPDVKLTDSDEVFNRLEQKLKGRGL